MICAAAMPSRGGGAIVSGYQDPKKPGTTPDEKGRAMIYQEPKEAGTPHRERIAQQLEELIRSERERARDRRKAYFKPDLSSVDTYAASIEAYRTQYKQMLGWPLTEDITHPPPVVREEPVAEDDLGTITRVWVQSLPELESYGILFLPKSEPPWPLVVSQHGGGGTPELCSNFFGPANYHDMSRRALRHDVAVFAPQLPMWKEEFGPKLERDKTDNQLKQLGSSMAALDVYQVRQCIRALCARSDIDETRVGMMGLSWGGFYTLTTAAVEPNIKVALTSCFFNDRHTYDLQPSVWFSSANRFLDAEIAALVCPRPLFIEIGGKDDLFEAAPARPEAAKVKDIYERLGIGDRFVFKEHDGGHAFDKVDDGIEFLIRWLKTADRDAAVRCRQTEGR